MHATWRLVGMTLMGLWGCTGCGASSTGTADTSQRSADDGTTDVSDAAPPPLDADEDIVVPPDVAVSDAAVEDLAISETDPGTDIPAPPEDAAPLDTGPEPDTAADGGANPQPDADEPALPSPDLVACYSFETPDDPLVSDCSLYGNHGTASEGVQRGVKGRWGFGVRFDGVTSNIHIPYDPILGITGPVTLEAWVFLDTPVAHNRFLIRKALQYQLSISVLPVADFVEFYSQPLGFARSENPIDFGVWVHVAATHDGEVARFYINGALESATPFAGSLPSNTNDLLLGGDGYNPNAPDGGLDEVRVWRVIRSEGEICEDGYGVYDPTQEPVCTYPELMP